MRYADYYDCDICNGIAFGMSLFVQGCPIHCKGCFNPETWDFKGGKQWTEKTEDRFIELAGRDYIKRISILGGSPLCKENVGDVLSLVQKLRKAYHDNIKIWIYTGYVWEEIIHDKIIFQILQLSDVLVDGPFEESEKDLSIPYRGSLNQRVIDVQKSIKQGRVVKYT